MVALVTSIMITGLMVYGIVAYGRRRPIDRPTSWGEAMLGSAFVFMLLLMVFGVVPDRWIRLTDNEWGWSVERMLFTEGQFLDGNPITFPPMRMDLKKVSDIVVRNLLCAWQRARARARRSESHACMEPGSQAANQTAIQTASQAVT